MALFKSTKAILSGDPIDICNLGDMSCNFTYIDYRVDVIRLLIGSDPSMIEISANNIEAEDSISNVLPFRVLNVGNSKPAQLLEFISAIEEAIGIEAIKNLNPIQAGDVQASWVGMFLLEGLTGYKPNTDLFTGIQNFVEWFREYYNG